MAWGYGRWAPYIPVAQRKAKAEKEAKKLVKKGYNLQPVKIETRTIASSFWGKGWCENLERYSDFANRIPRGRTYVRNGSVVDLNIAAGVVTALVAGSSLYKVEIKITKFSAQKWKELKEACSGSIGSLVELLQGKFSKGVMNLVSERDKGLFPAPREISMSCSCPDYATMCKHVAATLYGVGARLDLQPQLLFALRQVDHSELIDIAAADLGTTLVSSETQPTIKGDLSELFGVELDAAPKPAPKKTKPKVRQATKRRSNAKTSKAKAKRAKPQKLAEKQAEKELAAKAQRVK